MFRLTPVVRNLLIINVLVYLASVLAPKGDFGNCFGMPGAYATNMVSGYLSLWSNAECFKPYQLFTYMFVHGGILHIFFNMLMLAFVGPILESHWGAGRFAMFYAIAGIGAGIFNIFVAKFFGLGAFDTMVGASGAIYGLLMGYGLTFPEMELRLLIPPITIKAKYLVFLLGGISFLFDPSGNTAHFAHLGGAIFGLILVAVWKNQGRN